MIKTMRMTYTTEDDVHNFSEAETDFNKEIKKLHITKSDIISVNITTEYYKNDYKSRTYEKFVFTIIYWVE